MNERQAAKGRLDADEITAAAIAEHDHVVDVEHYRARLKAFVRDISRS